MLSNSVCNPMLSDQQNWMAVKWECNLCITRQNLVSSFGLVRARCLWEDMMQSLADQRGGKIFKLCWHLVYTSSTQAKCFTFTGPWSKTIVAYICLVIPLHSAWLNPPIHWSDQNLTSPQNIYILPNKRVIRILKVISAKSGYLDLTPYSCN